MDVQIIDDDLLSVLHVKAKENEHLRINFDLRTTPGDTSQRMLNALEPGTKVPIHRHTDTSETVVCLDGCLDWILYEEHPNNNGESDYTEKARYRICPREKKFGIQVPQGVWHSVIVHESSTILEAKDGAYK